MNLLVFFCLGGACINIGVFSKNVIAELISTTFPEAPSILKSPNFWAVIVIEGVILPLSCMREMKGLSYIAIVTCFIVPVILALSLGSFIKNIGTVAPSNINLAETTISQFLEAFVLFEYSFVIHPSIQSILY